MTRYLLDTDAVIDVLYDIAGSVALMQTLHEQGDTLCTCDVVVAEVFSGLHPHEREQGAAFLSSLEFLPTSSIGAQQAGELRYTYARQGRPLATTGCLIAAIALEHRATVVTGNIRDFPMPELTLLPLPRRKGRGG